MSNKEFKKSRGAFFGSKFTKLVDEYIEEGKDIGEKRTPETICSALKVSRQTFYNWKSGSLPDQYNFKKICDFFRVPEEEFYIRTHDEKYKFDSSFMDAVKESEIDPYCDKIGLDEEFVKVIRKQVNFDKLFPLWTPIDKNGDFFSYRYEQRSIDCLSDSAPMDVDTFQIRRCVEGEEGEKLITMSRPDLLFLSDVQREVSRYIKFRFMERQEEMKDEVEKVNKECIHEDEGGGTSYRPLTWKRLCEIAPYYKAFDVPEKSELKEE